MDEKTFKTRTKKLAAAVIKEVDKLPRSPASDVNRRNPLDDDSFRQNTSQSQTVIQES
ncbi:MAG: hypothetical protein ACXW4E_02545 [Anaerolineales bacterium]